MAEGLFQRKEACRMLYPVGFGILGLFLTPKKSGSICPSLNSHTIHDLSLPKQFE